MENKAATWNFANSRCIRYVACLLSPLVLTSVLRINCIHIFQHYNFSAFPVLVFKCVVKWIPIHTITQRRWKMDAGIWITVEIVH